MVFLLILLAVSASLSHPLLNLNAEERTVFDNLEASPYAEEFPVSIKPFSLGRAFIMADRPDRIKTYLNALSRPGYFLKPVNSVSFRLYYTNEEIFPLENMSGTLLRRGVNLYIFLDGYLSLGRRFVFYYQVRSVSDRNSYRADVFRAYMKLRLWKLSLLAGKDTVHLGPGEFGLLLSSNAEPFPMISLRTEEPLNLFGKWEFIFVRGFLREKRRDRDDPNILALRVVYKPRDFLEIGLTRTSLYGGEGRPGYTLFEYPKLILGVEENIPFGKFDTDGYAAYDFTLYLPLRRLLPSVRTFKVYFQRGGTDVSAWWQKDNPGDFAFPFGFRLHLRSYVAGVFLSLDKDILRLEYHDVNRAWYIHHLYPVEGYTYRGMSLGHPYGNDLKHIFLKHIHYFSDHFSAGYRFGFLRQPGEDRPGMNRFYIVLFGERRVRRLILEGFLRLDVTDNYDRDPLPNRIDIRSEDRTFITAGVGLGWRF
ncbi:MAG: capsule assembly Wzi family protein [Aquificota bacterium]|nr:capsule assembly Wzi family protein [Aquificota bacterium]